MVLDTLQRDVLVGAVFSATLFRNFSSHVNVRRDIFVLVSFEMLNSNTSVNSIKNPKTLHVLLRPKGAIFVFVFFQDFQKFPPDSNVISGKISSARALDLQMARFDLPLSALLQRLLFRAVRSLLPMRSLTDATELYTGMELHISACCPNQAEL